MMEGTDHTPTIELAISSENLQNVESSGNQEDTGGPPIGGAIEMISSSQNLQDALNPQKNYNTGISDLSKDQPKKERKWIFSIPAKGISLIHPKDAPLPNMNEKICMSQGWSFSSQQTDWSIHSRNILQITYRQSSQAVASYTNKNIAVDYVQRVFKRSRCTQSCLKHPHIYMEKYDADDILSVKLLQESDLSIRGFQECRGVQILLRNKCISGTRFPTSFKQTDHDRKIPQGGEKVLKEAGYIGEKDKVLDTGFEKKRSESAPIVVTFVMPNVDHQKQMEQNHDEKYVGTSMAPPLLWKVDMPQDASIALEAFTILDGNLNVHGEHSSGRESSDNYCNNPEMESTGSYSDDCNAFHPTNIYLNGYQSWSFAGSVTQGDEQPKPAMPDFLSKAFNFGADIPPVPTEDLSDAWVRNDGSQVNSDAYIQRSRPGQGSEEDWTFHELTHYKSDFYACVSCNEGDHGKEGSKLDEHGGPALILGFLSQTSQFGLVTFDSDFCRVAMHASCQGMIASNKTGISTDWAYCQLMHESNYDEEPMSAYFNAVSAYNIARPFHNFPPLTGWCSWYHYYENIDSKSLTENFKKLADLKTDITSDAVIIDDGYMTAWGDWDNLKPKAFPPSSGGMKALADSVTSNDMIPGLWMAPYACDKNSKLAKEHPDWIIRNDEGRFANSSNCGKFFYGLDATNPQVREYAFKCVRRAVKEWGYKVLKLDFLYAACLHGNGKYDVSMSRAETMYLALQTLRAAAGPETFIIGCGCPIGPGIGLLDANRVSADTGPTFYPDFPLPWWDHGTLPSLRAMVRNSVTRSAMGHRFWHNDPDCILLGKTTRLTDTEVKSAATVIAMTGGMLLLSDDLSKLADSRLRVATRIYPVTGITGVALDLHNTSDSGIPSLMRLWCTDEHDIDLNSISAADAATLNARRTGFLPDQSWSNPWKRERNCLPVAKGLGSWSIVSLSNWTETSSVVSIPMSGALPPEGSDSHDLHIGYHMFNFWASKYAWIQPGHNFKNLSKKLGPHESEIFHIKPVSLDKCQYIGSELHFTCGFEVTRFDSTSTSIDLQLRKDSKRSGFIYVYLPCYAFPMTVKVSGMVAQGEIIFKTPKIARNATFYGGQVVRIWAVIHGNGSPEDGRVTVNI